MQLLIAMKGSRKWGDGGTGLTTQMGKLRHRQEKPKAHYRQKGSQCWCLMRQHPARGLAFIPPLSMGVPKLWPEHPKVPDTLHLPEPGQEQ